jgi:hypothetical protein
VTGQRRWSPTRAIGAWLTSQVFARQLGDFLLLWMVFKGANAFTAMTAGLPPLAFRPGAEAGAFALEYLAFLAFLRHDREDLLLASLGLDRPLVLLPFALVHAGLSCAAATLA